MPITITIDRPRPLRQLFSRISASVVALASDREWVDEVSRVAADDSEPYQKAMEIGASLMRASQRRTDAPCSACSESIGEFTADGIVGAAVAASNPDLLEDLGKFRARHPSIAPSEARSYAAGWVASWVREGAAHRKRGRWGFSGDGVRVDIDPDRGNEISFTQISRGLLGVNADSDAILWARDSGGWTVYVRGKNIPGGSFEVDFAPGTLEELIADGVILRAADGSCPPIVDRIIPGVTVRPIPDSDGSAPGAPVPAPDDPTVPIEIDPASAPGPNGTAPAPAPRLGGLARRPDGSLVLASLLSTDAMYSWGCEIGDVVLLIDGNSPNRVPDDVLDRLEASRVIVSRQGTLIAVPRSEFDEHPDPQMQDRRCAEVFSVSYSSIRRDPDSFVTSNRLEGPTPEARPGTSLAQPQPS